MTGHERSRIRGWSRGAVLDRGGRHGDLAPRRSRRCSVNIMERKDEAQHPFFRVVELTDETADPGDLGQELSAAVRRLPAHRGSAAHALRRKRGPAAVADRGRSPLDRWPSPASRRTARLKTMWAGYAFATDFRKKRGHAYMLEDQTFTERVQHFKQPGTCIHCHASVYVPYRAGGQRRFDQGLRALSTRCPMSRRARRSRIPWRASTATTRRRWPLRVTRPGFLEGIRALQGRARAWSDYDVNAMATRQEMRSFVCGQCHDEYYFKGPEKRLVLSLAEGPDDRGDLTRTTPRSIQRTSRTPGPARACSRRSTPSSSCGTRVSTHGPGSPAPTATCRTPASVPRRSATITSAARC